jgi:hypothetical protein
MLGALMALSLAASDWECEYNQRHWGQLGLVPPREVLKAKLPEEQLRNAMERWSLTELPARCAIDALLRKPRAQDPEWGDEPRRCVGNADAWRECVALWPDQKALWVGLIASWDFRSVEPLVARLPAAPPDGGSSLAEELTQLEFGPGAPLALHVLETQPGRLSEFLDGGREDFEIALTALEERRPVIAAAEWEPVGRALLHYLLPRGDLVLAADLWMEFPEVTRASLRNAPIPGFDSCAPGGQCDDQRPLLAIGLIMSDRREEAARIPLGTSPVLDDLVTWKLTGKRTIDAWDAAIAARTSRRWQLMGYDFSTALYPFIAPHFALHDAERELRRGFTSQVGADQMALTAARLRSARAKSFLRLRQLVLQPRPVDERPAPTELLNAFIEATAGSRSEPRTTSGLKIFWNGDSRAFIEFGNGYGRADRDASGTWTVKVLARWISCF